MYLYHNGRKCRWYSDTYAPMMTLTSTCIRIEGTFTIPSNMTWILNNVDISMMTNSSEIIVSAGGALSASNNSNFHGCSGVQWNQIKVLPDGKIEAQKTSFSNAKIAINIAGTPNVQGNQVFLLNSNNFSNNGKGLSITGIQNYANHEVIGNTFTDCTNGIYMDKAALVYIHANKYIKTNPMTNLLSVVGAYIVSSEFIDFDGGEIFDANFGIRLQSASMVNIKNFDLITGKTGILSRGGKNKLLITNNNIKQIDNTAISVQDHFTVDEVVNGQWHDWGVVIDANPTIVSGWSGVRLDRIYGNGRVEVSSNKFSNGSMASTTHYAIGATNILGTARLRIEADTIWQLAPQFPFVSPGGIYVFNSKTQNKIRNNFLSPIAMPPTDAPTFDFGITVADSKNCQIVGNMVIGAATNRGISVENSSEGISLCCNTINHTRMGLYMFGGQNQTKVFNTEFNTHSNSALFYDHVMASNSQQFFRGNRWNFMLNTRDAVYDGDLQFLQYCQYKSNPTHLPNISKVFVVGGTASDWFKVISGSESTCQNQDIPNGYCGEEPYPNFGPGGGEEITGKDIWATNTLADPSYTIVHWEAQKELYSKLKKYPSLFNNYPELGNFYAAAANGTLGQLYELEKGISTLYAPSTNMSQTYINALAQLNSQYESLKGYQQALSTVGNTQVGQLQTLANAVSTQIGETKNTIAGIENQILAAVPAKIEQLKELANSLSANAPHLQYEKDAYLISLNALGDENYTFSEPERKTIDKIADKCILEGGNAVFMARNLQEGYCVPNWRQENCFGGGVSERLQEIYAKEASNTLRLQPNPANEYTRIDLDAIDQTLPSTLMIFDVLGRAVLTQKLDAGTMTYNCHTAIMESGIYQVTVQQSGRRNLSSKLSITH